MCTMQISPCWWNDDRMSHLQCGVPQEQGCVQLQQRLAEFLVLLLSCCQQLLDQACNIVCAGRGGLETSRAQEILLGSRR